jgi:hypothetical protein
LLRDILKGEDAEVTAVVHTLTQMRPDVVLLTGFDWDHHGMALGALAEKLAIYPHRLALRPNAGTPTGLDLDGDGRLGGAGDAQGYGRFLGQGGMALMSKHPLRLLADHSAALWAAQPDALLFDGMNDAQKAVQLLFPVGLWEVEVAGLHLIALSAGPPVFDGPEDRNGRRNADELAFAQRLVDAGPRPLVVLGNANLDPTDGEGRREAILALLDHPKLQDPAPRSAGAEAAANPAHQGDPALDTADWRDPSPGNLRVSYVLPDADLQVEAAGVAWPVESPAAPRHKLVWVDVMR